MEENIMRKNVKTLENRITVKESREVTITECLPTKERSTKSLILQGRKSVGLNIFCGTRKLVLITALLSPQENGDYGLQ